MSRLQAGAFSQPEPPVDRRRANNPKTTFTPSGAVGSSDKTSKSVFSWILDIGWGLFTFCLLLTYVVLHIAAQGQAFSLSTLVGGLVGTMFIPSLLMLWLKFRKQLTWRNGMMATSFVVLIAGCGNMSDFVEKIRADTQTQNAGISEAVVPEGPNPTAAPTEKRSRTGARPAVVLSDKVKVKRKLAAVYAEDSQENHRFYRKAMFKNRNFSTILLDGWRTMPQLNEEADLVLADPRGEVFTMVLIEPK